MSSRGNCGFITRLPPCGTGTPSSALCRLSHVTVLTSLRYSFSNSHSWVDKHVSEYQKLKIESMNTGTSMPILSTLGYPSINQCYQYSERLCFLPVWRVVHKMESRVAGNSGQREISVRSTGRCFEFMSGLSLQNFTNSLKE